MPIPSRHSCALPAPSRLDLGDTAFPTCLPVSGMVGICRMKRSVTLAAVAILVLLAGLYVWRGQPHRDTPRRVAIESLQELDKALGAADAEALLKAVLLPPAVADRTPAEQAEFLRKALADEVSPEGIKVLARDGAFGPLKQVFPGEANRWAAAAGVNPADCVAFRLERNGITAEVVVATNLAPPKVLRCNNVKQMAVP